MSYKPILFSTEMVRAILDGRKTQTRRVINPPPAQWWDRAAPLKNCNGSWMFYAEQDPDFHGYIRPKYQPKDILWVRETWCNVNRPGIEPDYYYLADARNCEDYDPSEWKWRPSIFMPKEACRLFLRVTGVRVERVQDITEEDALSEGCDGEVSGTFATHPVEEFSVLWETINGNRGYGWDINPRVWVYNFERIDTPKGWPNV